MMHLRGLVLFLPFLLGSARRSIRIDDFHHGAQQQNDMVANGLEVSADAREALIPSVFRRVGPQASAFAKGSRKMVGEQRGSTLAHTVQRSLSRLAAALPCPDRFANPTTTSFLVARTCK